MIWKPQKPTFLHANYYSCDKRFKTLGDVKKHIEETHKKANLFHIKMDRNDPNDISDILYSSAEVQIFSPVPDVNRKVPR